MKPITETDPFLSAIAARDEAMQLKGKRAVLAEFTDVANDFVRNGERTLAYAKAWAALDDKYAAAQPEVRRRIKPGSKWEGYKMNAEVCFVFNGRVQYWHTHHDGTCAVYTTPEEFFRRNCAWVSDPPEETDGCEGCGSPVAQHVNTERDASGSVRHSVKADGTACCTHLVPQMKCTCPPGNVSHQDGCPHWVMPY